MKRYLPLIVLAAIACPAEPAPLLTGAPWPRHVIDGVGRGSDGTKLADINGDGWLDVTTGWEEEGETRVYLNPGPRGPVRQPWPKIVVGRTPDVEDAVFADLDGDGVPDVVSSSEGQTRRMYVHWAPRDRNRIADATAWRQQELPASAGLTAWMFAEPLQFDGRHGVDLIAGSKTGPGGLKAWLGWFEAPPDARDLKAWRWHPLAEAGWIMSIDLVDLDGDGDRDVLYSDRKGPTRGVHWLEHPGTEAMARGVRPARHSLLKLSVDQVMFLATGDLDGDGRQDIVAGVEVGPVPRDEPNRSSRIVWLRRLDGTGRNFAETVLPVPANTGNIKGLALGDLDGDGRTDLVVSCENARGERRGLYWLRQGATTAPADWTARDLSGAPGIKFDLVRLLDLDGDGDLDVLANDEQEGGGGLGVVWYENPHR